MISVSIHPESVWKTPANKMVKTVTNLTTAGDAEVEL